MTAPEEAILFGCEGESLVGILHHGERLQGIGVVIVVGGPQYRVGSHRQFVLLARALAEAGYHVFRFDYRGMGDSGGTQRTFEYVNGDIAAAIDVFQRSVPNLRGIALWGLCDGASAALLYCHEMADSRVVGLALVNPWVRSVVSLARTQIKHYYLHRLKQRGFWVKLLSGKVATTALQTLFRNLSLAWTDEDREGKGSFQASMAAAWRQFDGALLLLLSGDDYGAKEFIEFISTEVEWRDAFARARVTRREIAGADHTFSHTAQRRDMEARTIEWLDTLRAET